MLCTYSMLRAVLMQVSVFYTTFCKKALVLLEMHQYACISGGACTLGCMTGQPFVFVLWFFNQKRSFETVRRYQVKVKAMLHDPLLSYLTCLLPWHTIKISIKRGRRARPWSCDAQRDISTFLWRHLRGRMCCHARLALPWRQIGLMAGCDSRSIA